MRLSTKGRFAVSAMMDLALREHAGPVSLAAISQRQQISQSYLEQLFSKLRQQGLVHSTRGPGGGYTLGRDAHQISVADVLAAVESAGPKGVARSEEESLCAATLELWQQLDRKMMDHMQGITLQTLVDEQRAKGVRVEPPRVVRRGIYAPRPVEPTQQSAPNSVFALGRALASGG